MRQAPVPDVSTSERGMRVAIELGGASVAMVVFAVFSHRGFPAIAISGLALLVTAWLIGRSARTVPEPLALLGMTEVRPRVIPLALVGAALFGYVGTLQLAQSGASGGSGEGIQAFVVVACLIGATEELVYRGWLQGRASGFGWPAAVLIAALAHAAYKTALFAWPPESQTVAYDLVGIGLLTAAGGVALGLLRVSSGSLAPAVLGHVAFDAVVYSSYAQAPWWVWS